VSSESSQPRATSSGERTAEDIGRSRELALLVACHLESYAEEERAEALELAFREASSSDRVAEGAGARIAELGSNAGVLRTARKRLESLVASWPEVDATIESISNKWRLERMHHIERNLIRLALVEFRDENTKAAVLNAESVRLANRYGSENASRFVNGIVDALVKQLRS
jgi:N utilization substance protein B